MNFNTRNIVYPFHCFCFDLLIIFKDLNNVLVHLLVINRLLLVYLRGGQRVPSRVVVVVATSGTKTKKTCKEKPKVPFSYQGYKLHVLIYGHVDTYQE